jgi:hypothetical protein
MHPPQPACRSQPAEVSLPTRLPAKKTGLVAALGRTYDERMYPTALGFYLVAMWVGGIFVACVMAGFMITLVVDRPGKPARRLRKRS